MIKGIVRRILSPEIKEIILKSKGFRLWERSKLSKKEIRFSVELTTKCNLSCQMCTRFDLIRCKGLKIGEMEMSIIAKILAELKNFNKAGYKIVFAPMGMGEPLMYSGLIDLIKKIKKISKEIEVVIVTNGILLNKELSDSLISAGTDEISISLNAVDRESYLKNMKVDAFDKVVSNIKILIEERNRRRRSTPRVYVQYLEYGNELIRIKNCIRDWSKIMSFEDKCYYHPIVNQAGYKKGKTSVEERENFPCISGIKRVWIKRNGDIFPCDPCFYGGEEKTKELFLGNIKNISIFEMFKDKNNKARRIVDRMRRNDYEDIEVCRKCNTYKLGVNCYFKNPTNIGKYKWL